MSVTRQTTTTTIRRKQQQQIGITTTTNEGAEKTSHEIFARSHTIFYSILICVAKKRSFCHIKWDSQGNLQPGESNCASCSSWQNGREAYKLKIRHKLKQPKAKSTAQSWWQFMVHTCNWWRCLGAYTHARTHTHTYASGDMHTRAAIWGMCLPKYISLSAGQAKQAKSRLYKLPAIILRQSQYTSYIDTLTHTHMGINSILFYLIFSSFFFSFFQPSRCVCRWQSMI